MDTIVVKDWFGSNMSDYMTVVMRNEERNEDTFIQVDNHHREGLSEVELSRDWADKILVEYVKHHDPRLALVAVVEAIGAEKTVEALDLIVRTLR